MEPPVKGINYIGVGVGAVVRDEQGRFLLAKRGPGARNERGKWEFPGGAVRFNETLRNALEREILEEFGVRVETGELVGVADHILPEENQHWVSPAYFCRVIEGTARILEPGKCDGFAWVAPEDVHRYELTVASDQTCRMLEERGFLPLRHGSR